MTGPLRVALEPYALRFRRPMPTPHGAIGHRRGWVLRIQDDAGYGGLGDAAGWPGFGASDDAIAADLHRLVADLGAVPPEVAREPAWLDAHCRTAEVRHAAELALYDHWGRRSGRRVAALLHGDGVAAGSVPSHQLVGLEGDDHIPAHGDVLKLKVGVDLDREASRLEALAQARTEARVRLDAGGRWRTEREAEAALRRLARAHPHIELVEQPLPPGDLDAIVRLRACTDALGLALALDEGVVRPEDFDAVLAARAADVVVLKPMYLGGPRRTLDLAQRARAAGIRVVVTHALESAVGRTGAAHLAAGLPGVHGLSAALADDVAAVPTPADGRLALPPGSGLGVRLRPATPPSATDLPHPLLTTAVAAPERPAVVDEDGAVTTYAALSRNARRYATAFAADGVGAGVVVGLAGAPSPAWVAALHGLGLLGAAVVPLPAAGSERRATLDATRPRMIVSVDRQIHTEAPWSGDRFWPLDETRLIVCSSGSTGAPRAIPLTTAQLTFSAFASATRLGLRPDDDRWLCCLPLHHVGGASILFRSAFYGTGVELHARFDAARVAATLQHGATLVSLVPQMLERVLDRLDAEGVAPPPSTLRAVLVGGGPLDARTRARAHARGLPVAETWGMTEAASQLATLHPSLRPSSAHPLSRPSEQPPALPPLPFVRVGQAPDGRLTVAGPLIGHASPQVTQDRGEIDDGRVRITGRADEVIISGGEKIRPGEVEAALRGHAGIADAVVVGVPSSRWGARPVAFVEGRPQPLDALRSYLAERLPRYAVPDRFIWRDALPRSALGKVRRAQLQREVSAPASSSAPPAGPDHRRGPPALTRRPS
ncbi:MAG: AMP-binding protein [Myxococcota bacterium]